MTDEELIGYCEIHCETERALFSRDHVARMLKLAGVKPIDLSFQQFYSMHEEMAELCKLARERIKKQQQTVQSSAKIIPFPVRNK